MKKFGFTLIETLTTIAILVIVAAIAIPAIYSFQKKSDLESAVGNTSVNLELAKNLATGSEALSQYGIYFDTVATPHELTLFQGVNFASRNVTFDEVFVLPKNTEFSALNLNGGGSEVVFNKITGDTSQYGSIDIVLTDGSATSTIYIETSGKISSLTSVPSDASRVKDSRHVHLTYTRIIDISILTSENIILDFGGGIIETINIYDNLSGGQLFWEGDVDVSGDNQHLKVHTHLLNRPRDCFLYS